MRLTAEVGANISLLVQGGTTAVLSPDESVMAFVGSPTAGAAPVALRAAARSIECDAARRALMARSCPVFSPDGNSVAFFAQGKLKKVAITGGTPMTLCDAPNGRGSTWSDDGWIYFTPDAAPNQGIQRVRAEGGTPEMAVKIEGKELSLRFPQILPGSKVLLFTAQQATGSFETADIVAYSLADGVRKVVLQGGYHARYVRSGHLLYVEGRDRCSRCHSISTRSR